MAASRIIEQESGTFTGRLHRHNGYYAGDFSDRSSEARSSAVPHHPIRPEAHDSWNRSQR